MMQKRTLYSLLLTSFILVCAFSLSFAQEVTVQSPAPVPRCATDTLNIDVINPTTISAFEIILEISEGSGGAFFTDVDVLWDPALTVLTNRIIDLTGVDYASPDTIRIAGMMIDPGDACLSAGQTTVAQLEFTTNNACDGTVELDGATFTCPTTPVSAQTQFVDCATTTLITAAVNPGTVTIQNDPPTIDPIADTSVHWGDSYVGQAVGHDPDLANGCEKLTYSKLVGPAALTVNAVSGLIIWPTLGTDVGIHPVTIQVEDSCGATTSTDFEICVFNLPPTITCPTDTLIGWGDTLHVTIIGNDPDGGPSPLTYSIVSFSGSGLPSQPTINAATGELEWVTEFDADYTGYFQFCVDVNDGAPVVPGCSERSADTCCFEVLVVPFLITIEKTHNTPQGQIEEVEITMLNHEYENYPMGGFDFLIAYDRSALNFQLAAPGQFLVDCGWEYFTYRWWFWPSYEPHFFWGGIVRIVAMAETNNGANHPDCFTNFNVPGVSNQLVVLRFMVTDNRLFECQYVPIRFFWTDCGDNTISSVSGDTLFISRHIYEFEDSVGISGIEDLYAEFPTYLGANYTCDVDTGDGKPDPLRLVDFVNGGVDIVCAESIDARGDINLNGIAYEVADAVVFTNYFILGLEAFHVSVEGQIAATDVNADGLTLTVGDLVYLVRVIVGDALPYPKVTTPVNASYSHGHDGVLRVTDDVAMGAAYVVLEGDVTPTLLAPDMEMKYNFNGENTRVLVYSLEGNSFMGEFLNTSGEIVSIEMATREGNPVVTKLIPANFALNQNYPNPFNPATIISFALPTATNYTLTIYNVNGQEVESFVGSHEAGMVELEWDAANHASGIYFYKLDAGSFTATKKMVLLK